MERGVRAASLARADHREEYGEGRSGWRNRVSRAGGTPKPSIWGDEKWPCLRQSWDWRTRSERGPEKDISTVSSRTPALTYVWRQASATRREDSSGQKKKRKDSRGPSRGHLPVDSAARPELSPQISTRARPPGKTAASRPPLDSVTITFPGTACHYFKQSCHCCRRVTARPRETHVAGRHITAAPGSLASNPEAVLPPLGSRCLLQRGFLVQALQRRLAAVSFLFVVSGD